MSKTVQGFMEQLQEAKRHFAKGFLLFVFSMGLYFTSFSQENSVIEISGQVVGQEKKEALEGVSIQVKGAIAGTITNSKGKFTLRTKLKFPFTLQFSSIGYQPQEFVVTSVDSKLNIALSTQSFLGKEVVVTASRVAESILKSPVAIQKLDIRAIRESPAPSFYDALENVKGVQMITSSLTFKVPNTRGFNIPNNFRFMQLVDGVDMQAATLGVPLGNAIGPTELDIASVEITPGAASALYGMNAINGMANLITKSPFTHQGLCVYQKFGLNHLGGTGRDGSLLTETAIRYAQAINNKFAFKVNGSYLHGTDWLADTRKNQNTNNLKTANPSSVNPGFAAFNSDADNPAFDGWNKYGDDALAGSNTVAITETINGKSSPVTVARTGYWEKDLIQPAVKNIKFDAGLYYRLSDRLELSYNYRVGKMDGVFQRGNKVQLNNVLVQNHKIELKGADFVVRAYESIESTGDSYNVKPLADNLDLYTGGSNSQWATKYTNALTSFVSKNGPLTSANLAEANRLARIAADAGRAEPGSQRFTNLIDTIRHINNWDIKSSLIPDAPVTGGAALIQKSHLYHAEAQWDLSKKVKIFDLLVGGDARVYSITPDGNNFVDFDRSIADRNKEINGSYGNNVYYKKFGGFTQVTKTFFKEKLKVFGSVRYDYNPYFDPKITPRVAAVYTVNQQHNFRFTFQQGYRFPSLFEALSYVNNGRVKRVGSLPFINDGLNYLNNSYYQSSVANFNDAVNTYTKGSDTAALRYKNLLQVANLPTARPEKITSFEIGYKSVLLDNKLVIDFDAYTNVYNGFLGQVQVFVPKGQTVGTDSAVLSMLNRNRDAKAATPATGNAASQGQDRYRVYTNAKNDYNNYGASLGVTYNVSGKYIIGGNINYNNIATGSSNDIFVTGFNTPHWAGNVSFGNREIFKNIGFNVVWKWQDAFLWESPLVTGDISAFSTFDGQVSFKLPSLKSTIKLGASDLLNIKYIQYAGGPTIGAFLYGTITVDGLLTK
ncbi:TonB-dependent receptor [Parasediminibacterium sp. JCM 36343]|uniref:TonB-dependent receptor n=1 Tax=Parasediminibacterium sp. JCM 36343 TaxID=3374279 RepID=UPI00397C432A